MARPPPCLSAADGSPPAVAASLTRPLQPQNPTKNQTVAVVHEGYVLNKSVVRSLLAGAALNQLIRAAVESRPAPGASAPAAATSKRGAAAQAAAAATGNTLKILPRHLFRRVQKDPPDGPWRTERLDAPAGTTASFNEYAVLQIAADLKEALCRVSDMPLSSADGGGGGGAGAGAGGGGAGGGDGADGGDGAIPTVAYELPDGTEIQVGSERFRAPEALFQPGVLASWPGGGCSGAAALPAEAEALRSALPALVAESVARCDVDARRELYSGVVLTGGTSLLPSLRERLERELADNVPVPGTRVKVVAPTGGVERRFGPWIGGSILASLGSFQQMWMSKQEYDEHGASLIHRKSP
jgi:actin-like protein 6A